VLDIFNFNIVFFPFDLFCFVVGDDEEVVAVEFFGGFYECIEFAFSGFLREHVIADLN